MQAALAIHRGAASHGDVRHVERLGGISRLFAPERGPTPPSSPRWPARFVRRIFLDVMAPRDLHLGQRWYPADEGEILVVGEDRTGLGPEEQLGHTAR